MKLEKIVNIGDAIELNVKTSVQSDEVIELKTMVQDTDQDSILVNLPRKDGVPYIPSDKAEIKVTIPLEAAGLYMFYVKFISKTEVDGIKCIKLKLDSEIKKSQRRQYFRLNFVGQVNISLKDLEENIVEYVQNPRVNAKIVEETLIKERNEEKIKFFLVSGRDISGGGFRAHGRMPLPKDIIIDGVIELGNENVPFRGKVVRCEAVQGEYETYEIGVSFDGIDDAIRSKIVGFIFEKQRKMMKR